MRHAPVALALANVNDSQDRCHELPSFRKSSTRDTVGIPNHASKVERWRGVLPIEKLGRSQIRDFLDWVYERAVAEAGTNPGRTANKAREHLRAVLWAWDQELIDFSKAQAPARHCWTALSDEGGDQCAIFCHSRNGASSRLEQCIPAGAVLANCTRAVL
jgi:hypothetical protein